MTGGAVDGSGVCGGPTGVVAVSVFDGVDGVVATLVDVAVVAIDTAVVAVHGAGLDDSIVGGASAVISVTAEAESCVGKGEYGFGEGDVVEPATVVTAVLCAAGVGAGVVGTMVGDVAGVAWVGHGSYENSTGILVAVTAVGACAAGIA